MNIGEFVEGIEPVDNADDFRNVRFPTNDGFIYGNLASLQGLQRMSTYAIGGIINYAVSQMNDLCAYLNVGVWHGYTLFAGMLSNSTKRCVGVDNFSQFDKPEKFFMAQFAALQSTCHEFYTMDYREYLSRVHLGKVGVYLFDGPHDYDSQIQGLELALPHLVQGSIVIVDDTDWKEPYEATMGFLDKHKDEFLLVTRKKGKTQSDPYWWNGLMILEHI